VACPWMTPPHAVAKEVDTGRGRDEAEGVMTGTWQQVVHLQLHTGVTDIFTDVVILFYFV
jgi:hypothetical protein